MSGVAHSAPYHELGFEGGGRLDKRWNFAGGGGLVVTDVGGREGSRSYKFVIGSKKKKPRYSSISDADINHFSAIYPEGVYSAENINNREGWFGFSVFIPRNFKIDKYSEDIFLKFSAEGNVRDDQAPFYLAIKGNRIIANILGGQRGMKTVKATPKEDPIKVTHKNRRILKILAGGNDIKSFTHDLEIEPDYYSKTKRAIGRIKPGEWHDFVIYTRPSLKKNSFIYVYINGEIALNYRGAVGIDGDDSLEVTMGIWRKKWQDKDEYIKDVRRKLRSRVLYIDSFRSAGEGAKFEDVMPGRGPLNATKDIAEALGMDKLKPLPRKLTPEEVSRKFRKGPDYEPPQQTISDRFRNLFR